MQCIGDVISTSENRGTVKSFILHDLLVESDPGFISIVFARNALVSIVRVGLDVANLPLACAAHVDIAHDERWVMRLSFQEYSASGKRCSRYLSKVGVSDSRVAKDYD